VDDGNITEKFIISSGSYSGGKGHLLTNKKYYWATPTQLINAGQDIDQSVTNSSQFIMSGSEVYHPQPRFLRIVASGSLISMYDGSTKQIQDVEVGDVVKSYQPIGMPDESEGISWESYTTTDLSGSFSSGSIVVETINSRGYGYYLINGSIKVPAVPHTIHGGGKFFCKTGDTWSWKQSTDISVGDYFLNNDGSELEITSKTDVLSDETFYGLNVEDIDTYFQSNILVHNIPPFCFVAGTPITMADGTTKAIELIEVNDEIKNYDFDTKEIKVGKVLSIDTPTHADIIEISFGNKKTKNTFDHPYWVVEKGWSSYKPQWTEKRYNIKSEQLEVGDKCLELQGNKIVETNITDIQEDINPVQTYSLGVETHYNYFANDMLVHNKGGGSFCFTYDTMITLADGTYQPICKIRPNDMIKTYDVETGKLQNSKVLETVKVLHDNMVTYKFNDNTKIEATDDHPFYIVGDSEVDSDYRPLTIGDVVLNDELQEREVVNIEVNNVEKITYNINRTDNGKNYFANRVLVSDEFDTE
jgi:intein/homing endonuclease